MTISDNSYQITRDASRIKLAQQALSTYDPNVKISGTWDEISHQAFLNFGEKAFYSDTSYAISGDGKPIPNGTNYCVVITHGNWGRDIRAEEDRAQAIEDFLTASYGGKPAGGWQYGTHFLFNGNGGVYNSKGMSSNPLFDRSKLTGDAAKLSDAVLESELYRDGFKDIRFDMTTGGTSAVKSGDAQFGSKTDSPDALPVFRGFRDQNIDFRQLGFSSSERPYTTLDANGNITSNGSFTGRSILQFLGYIAPALGAQSFERYYAAPGWQVSEAYHTQTTERLTDAADTSGTSMFNRERPQIGDTGEYADAWIDQLLSLGLLTERLTMWTQECENIVLRMLGLQSA